MCGVLPVSFEQAQGSTNREKAALDEHIEPSCQTSTIETVKVVCKQKLLDNKTVDANRQDAPSLTSAFLSGHLRKAIEEAQDGKLHLSEEARKLLVAHGNKVVYLDTRGFEDLHLYANEILALCPKLEGQMKVLFLSSNKHERCSFRSIAMRTRKLLNCKTKMLIDTLKTFKVSQFSEVSTKEILKEISDELMYRGDLLTPSEIAQITVAIASTIFFDEKIVDFLRQKIVRFVSEMSLQEILDIAAVCPLFVDELALGVDQLILTEISARLKTLSFDETVIIGKTFAAIGFGTCEFFEKLRQKPKDKETLDKENIPPVHVTTQTVTKFSYKPFAQFSVKPTPPPQFIEKIRTLIKQAKDRDELCLIWKDYGDQFEETLIMSILSFLIEYGRLSLSAQKVIFEIFEKATLYFHKMSAKNLVTLCSYATDLEVTESWFFIKIEEALFEQMNDGTSKIIKLASQELCELIFALNEAQYGSLRLATAIKNILLSGDKECLFLASLQEHNLTAILRWLCKIQFKDSELFNAIEAEITSRITKDPFNKKISKEEKLLILELFASSGFGSAQFYQLLINRLANCDSLSHHIQPQFLAKLVHVLADKKVENVKFFALLENELLKEEATTGTPLSSLSQEDLETLKAALPQLGISSKPLVQALETWHWAKTTFA